MCEQCLMIMSALYAVGSIEGIDVCILTIVRKHSVKGGFINNPL